MRAWARAACLIAFVAAIFCLFLPPQAQASEEILSFHADIEVLPDGTLDVTETIRYAIGAGVETRGIARDLSMNVRTESDRPARVTFTIVSVSRNGQPEPYRIVRQSGLARISVGPVEEDLPAPSEQLYEIRYRTGGRVQAFDGQDVLNWSVTGEHWRIPIRTASVTVTLPEGVSLHRHTAERHGSNGRALLLDLNKAADGSLLASTNNVLLPGDGLTISFAWKKLPPVEQQQQPNSPSGSRNSGALELDQLPGNWPLLFTPTLLGGLIFLACRLAAGRHLSPGVISPEFEPPDGIGPAEARYLLERAYDDRCLAAAIANMAVKRALLIEQEPSRSPLRQLDFRLVPLGKAGKGLTATERAIYDALFGKPIDLTLNGDHENSRRVYQASSAAMSWLSALNENKVLSNNPKCFFTGVAVAVGSAVILPYVSHVTQNTDKFFVIWLVSLFAILVLAILIFVIWIMIRIGVRTIGQIGGLVVFFSLLFPSLLMVSATFPIYLHPMLDLRKAQRPNFWLSAQAHFSASFLSYSSP